MENKETINQIRATVLSSLYPIGAIYMSTNSTNPEDIFGGKWEPFAQGRTIIGNGQCQENEKLFITGETGGSCTHTLTVNEMPIHTHEQQAHSHTSMNKEYFFWFNQFQHGEKNKVNLPFENHGCYNNDENLNVTLTEYAAKNDTNGIGSGSTWGHRKLGVRWNIAPEINSQVAQNNNTGGSLPHSILPPYIVTYIWHRIG